MKKSESLPIEKLHPVWKSWLGEALDSPSFSSLRRRVKAADLSGEVYPPPADRLRVFSENPLDLKVVILGQDPYHGPGQAHGLAFSVSKDCPIPPSLRNIYKEVEACGGQPSADRDGCLESWSAQGVMLLNTVLTVENGRAHSHSKWGWEEFTSSALSVLSKNHPGLIFMLWGAHASNVANGVIDMEKHHAFHAPHPSPLSAYRGFLGCSHFSKANALLLERNQNPIVW